NLRYDAEEYFRDSFEVRRVAADIGHDETYIATIEFAIIQDRKRLAIVEEALIRCKEILDSLECGCDEDYGFMCSLHGDRRLVKAALDALEGDRSNETD
ncbi:MAG: hypothetical protein ABIK92_21940, partial [Pseudomonadota bacterium]